MKPKINITKVKEIFKEKEDGKWHINFREWIWNIVYRLIGSGLFPIAFYTLISRTLNVTLEDIFNPSILALFLTYLVLRLIPIIANPPQYMYEPKTNEKENPK